MTASISQVHMGMGSFSFEHEWDPSIAAVLQGRYCHLVVYWGEAPFYAGVVTDHEADRKGMVISGRGADWWLGFDGDGPLRRDIEYIAGNNRLDNGDFSYADDLWQISEGTLWSVVTGSATMDGGSIDDDVLPYDVAESTRPGNLWRSALTVSGGLSGVGRLRLRTTYEGRFTPANVLANPGFEFVGASRAWGPDTTALTIVDDSGLAHTGSRLLRASTVPQPQLIAFPGFEDGGAGWSSHTAFTFVDDAAEARNGTWALRVGPIDRPQLLANPGFEGTADWGNAVGGTVEIVTDAVNARTGTGVLRASEIPKPQLLANSTFATSADWTLGSHLAIVTDAANDFPGTADDGVLRISPITQPQLLTNPGFEDSGTGWTWPATGEFSVPLSVPENVFEGSLSLKAGPVDRDDVIPNGDFEDGLTGWNPEPIPSLPTVAGDWYQDGDAAHVFDGGNSATTTGGGPDNKWLRSMLNAPPDDFVPVNPGERYRFEAKVRSTQDDLGEFDGEAHISVVFSATPGGTLSTWTTSGRLKAGAGIPGWDWNDLFVEFEVPEDQLCMYPHLVVQGHTKGYWSFDAVRLFKLRDNVSEAYSDAVTVEAEQTYEVSAMVRSDVALSQGEVQVRVELTGPSVPVRHHTTTSQGSTKRRGFSARDWVKLSASFSVEEGYTTAKVFVVARDVLGGSFRVDNVRLTKTSNNTDEATATTITVVPKQQYEMAAMVRSGPELKGGTVHLRTRLSGAGKPDIDIVTTRRGATKNKWERIATAVTPPKGYTSATVAVVGTDVLGDNFWVDDVEFLKDRNNMHSLSAVAVFVTPEQSYRLSGHVRPSEGTTEGSVFLRARVIGVGKPDVIVESGRQGLNEDDEWVEMAVNVRPGRGYLLATVTVVSVDVEGDPLWIDDVLFEKADGNTAKITKSPALTVEAGSTYRILSHVRSGEELSGGTVTVGAVLSGAGVEDLVVSSRGQGNTDTDWLELEAQVRVEEGYTSAVLFVLGTDIDGDYFWVDDVTVTKTTNNSESMASSSFAVTPGRSYRWTEWVSSTDGVTAGNVRLVVRFAASGREDVIQESRVADGQGEEWKVLDFAFTPPSGYDTATPSIVATDVAGGFFFLDDGDIRDTDVRTQVHDRIVGPSISIASTYSLDTTAPEGSERVRVELVAESSGGSYVVTNVSLSRREAISTTGDIVEELLRDPRTGLHTCLTPGNVFGADAIQHDIHWRNVTSREALFQLCRNGLALPVREYRVNPDWTLDFGTAEQICEDRPEILLVGDAIVVADEPQVRQSAENLVTDLTVIGADRESSSGVRRVVEGIAASAPTSFDRFGNPVRRDRIVTESSISHAGVAYSFAAYQLSLTNTVAENVTVDIADWRALGGPDKTLAPDSAPSFRPGDWVYLHKPEAGLEDAAYERTFRGRTVYPARKRLVSRDMRLGEGSFRVELIGNDGEVYPLRGIRWEAATTASLELGDLLPEFATDPQGGTLSNQFNRWRASLG